jgi:hypothetical protein
MNRAVLYVAVVAGVLLSSTVAIAISTLVGTGGNVFQGCVDKNGHIRLLEPGVGQGIAQCKANEEAIELASGQWVAALESRIDSLDGQMGDVQTQMGDVQAQVNSQGVQMMDLQSLTAALGGDLNSLQATVGGVSGQVALIEARLLTAEGDITGLGSQLGALSGRVDDLSSEAGLLAGRVGGLELQDNAFTIQLGSLQGELGGLETQLDDLAARVGALESGAPSPPTMDLEALYTSVLDILGATAVVVPLADPAPGTTFTTRGAVARAFEASDSLSDRDTLPGLLGVVPVVSLNGVDEEFDSPDDDYWSRGNGVVDSPFSIGIWIKSPDLDAALFAKYDLVGRDNKEWFLILSSGRVYFTLWDENVRARIGRTHSSRIPSNQWVHIVGTYDGGSASSGIKIYQNGIAVDDSNFNSRSYTAMENIGAVVSLGYWFTHNTSLPSNFLTGDIAGGALGPFFVQEELTAVQVSALYDLGAAALGLQ